MNTQKFNQLIRRITYDKDALTQIYSFYYPRVVMHLRRRFGKTFHAEDLAQEFFLFLMSVEIDKYIKYPTTWLYKIIDRKAIDIFRREKGSCPIPETYPANFSVDDLIMQEDVRRCFKLLDEKSQYILYLHIWEGYSHIEIAEMLQISFANVRTKASRAYSKIKKYLKNN